MVSGTGCQDTRRDRRAGLGGGGLRAPEGRERRIARQLLRCVRLAGTRPGQVLWAKVGPDRVKPIQLRFIELALRFHLSEQFMIIEVAGPSRAVRQVTCSRTCGANQGRVRGMRLSAMRPSHVKTWTAGLRMEGKQSNDGTLGPLAVSYVYACHARLAQIMSDAVAMLAPHLSRSGEAAPLCRHDRATLGPIRRDAGKARCCRSAPRTCRAAAGRVMRVACLRCRFHARHRLPADAVPGRGTEDRDL